MIYIEVACKYFTFIDVLLLRCVCVKNNNNNKINDDDDDDDVERQTGVVEIGFSIIIVQYTVLLLYTQ
jgi:hypothetical protein